MIKTKYLLSLICLLFLFTRFYKINEIPSSVYWDEASIGYNAYSIIQTGKDEWGKAFPIHFRAFGEFKLPVYIYAVVPAVWIFGLNVFSVRLPAVLFSLGVVILTYFLAKKLSGNTKVGLLSSFLVSVSPWFFIFSRTGYEATAGLMFYLLAIYLFLLFLKNKWSIPLSILAFILSAYSYNSFRIVSPLTIFILMILYFKDMKKSILPIIVSTIILAISIAPIYRSYIFDSGAVRLQTVAASRADFIKNYFSHFNPIFLFIRGDSNLRSQQSGFGQLYLPELILLPLGLLYITRSKSKYKFLPFVLLLIGPLPAAITKESPHALRAISMVPFISTISAMGALYFRRYLFVALIFLAFFLNYFVNFLNIYPVQSSVEWQYPYKKIYSNNLFDQYQQIIVSDRYAQPYIFALFYLKYDPDKFRQEVVRNNPDQWGFSTVKKFGKFEFGKFSELVSFIK